MSESLFEVAALTPAEPVPVDAPTPLKMNAEDVKDALRGRHPSDNNTGGMVGQWTCIEEWRNIDFLALNAWAKGDVIGYEVKVSRSDMRHELLRPDKRAAAVAMTTEFYFAVPAGMLTAEEIAFAEPEWQPGDFRRVACPGVPEFGGLRHAHARHQACGGKGYLDRSRVEREAPTLWVPRDVGLVVCAASGTRVVKRSPKRTDPKPIAVGRKHLNDLVRWVSHRPDQRHRRAA